jgi:hypothetical protein
MGSKETRLVCDTLWRATRHHSEIDPDPRRGQEAYG